MKKSLFIIAMMLISIVCFGQAPKSPAKVEKSTTTVVKDKDGNYRQVSLKSKKDSNTPMWANDEKTNKTYTTAKGEVYQVYIHTISRGDRKGTKVYCVYITPKSGKVYRKEIDTL